MSESKSFEGERQALIQGMVDILIKEVVPDSDDEKFMLGPSMATNLGFDKVYARTKRAFGLKEKDLDNTLLEDVLLEYARRRGLTEYIDSFNRANK